MPPEKTGFSFYTDILGSPKYVVAPMVDASELAWRQLGRRYKADLCYSPMFHAGVFVRDAKYRKESLQTCPEDRPLIVQFCANDPEIFLQAAKLTIAAIDCQAIDLNLGCPQIIAKRGHFGSFLQDEWELIHSIISTATKELDIPITAKCRIFPDVAKSIEYARMLEKAGAQLITVHGRTREQKGPLTGLASWDHIKAVKEAVSVPMFANGNIQYLEDADNCIQQTGVEGVMSAEGHLTNPCLFAGINPPVWEVCIEYLDLVDQYPCPTSYVRGHLFKMLHHCFQIKTNFDLREVIAKSSDIKDFRQVVLRLKERYLDFHTGNKTFEEPEEISIFKLKFPPWICQPYVRPSPEQHLNKMKQIQEKEKNREKEDNGNMPLKRANGEKEISKRKMKKLERNPHKAFSKARENCKLCVNCSNPAGLKCAFDLCKKCCKDKAYHENFDCAPHKIFVKTNREKAKARWLEKQKNVDREEVSDTTPDVDKTLNPPHVPTVEMS